MRMLRSTAVAEWVRAPTEMKSTPVLAQAAEVLRLLGCVRVTCVWGGNVWKPGSEVTPFYRNFAWRWASGYGASSMG